MDKSTDMEPQKHSCLKTETQRFIAGYLCAFGVSSSAAVIFASGQLLSNNVPVFQSSAITFTVYILMTVILLLVNKQDPRITLQK